MPANIRTHPSFLVEEGLPAEDGAEGALGELPAFVYLFTFMLVCLLSICFITGGG